MGEVGKGQTTANLPKEPDLQAREALERFLAGGWLGLSFRQFIQAALWRVGLREDQFQGYRNNPSI